MSEPVHDRRPWWRRSSLRQKLQLSIVGYALLVLLICAVSLIWFTNSYFHQKTQRDLQVLATVLADNSRAAVIFDDADAAKNVLAAAKGNGHIQMALIQKDGVIFAAYPDSVASQALANLGEHAHERVWLENDHYYASVPIHGRLSGHAHHQGRPAAAHPDHRPDRPCLA